MFFKENVFLNNHSQACQRIKELVAYSEAIIQHHHASTICLQSDLRAILVSSTDICSKNLKLKH